MSFARTQPIPPRSSPGVMSWFARSTGRQTSGAARWATGRRAIAGGDGATCITGGDGAPRIIGRRIGMAGAAMHGRGRCRQRGAENDCGGQRDCCPAQHYRISGLSCRGLTPNRLATAAPSRHGDGDRRRPARQDGWCEAKPIKFPRAGCGFSRGSNPSFGLPDPQKRVIARQRVRPKVAGPMTAPRSNPARP
jgi:hypothetical protein